MKKEEIIKNALKTLMVKKSLSNITVLSLCEYCKIPRQTFYYHFTDIYDVLSSIYLSENIPGLSEASDWNDIVKIMCEYISKNKSILYKALTSGAEDVVFSFFYDSIYLKGVEINTQLYALRLSKDDIREVTRLVADIYSREFGRMASMKKTHKKDDMYLKMNTTFNGLVELLVSNRRNKVSTKRY